MGILASCGESRVAAEFGKGVALELCFKFFRAADIAAEKLHVF